MKKITEFDTFTKVKNYSIIPNPIDKSIFSYKEKNQDDRKKILIIRSFSSKKYANDLSVKALRILSKEKWFSELYIEIYGEGIWFQKLTDQLKEFSNIKIFNKYLSQNDIKSKHDEFGVFLCPTRMDAQGVSMCEAMSSGLVPITSNNTAIPEFVKHNFNGLMSKNNPKLIAKNIKKIYQNSDLFLKLSINASKSIIEKSELNVTMNKEIELINTIINQ